MRSKGLSKWIGEHKEGARTRNISLRCVSATGLNIPPASLDAVFTDPPYFGNVQYGELMDFCYVWLRQLLGTTAEGFTLASSRSVDELTGHQTEERGFVEFAEGLGTVYAAMAKALKPGAPLAFTFHHNRLQAYETVGVAILDAGLTCSASLPCPAEMGSSIHIHGSGSSIVDTVFVCRAQGQTHQDQLFSTPRELAALVRRELVQLRAAGMSPSAGDIRCIVYGHLTRMAVWELRKKWSSKCPTTQRLSRFRAEIDGFGNVQAIIDALVKSQHAVPDTGIAIPVFSQDIRDAVSF